MVEEGWSLSDVIAFAKEYKLNLSIVDSAGTNIPDSKYSEFNDKAVTEQSRPKGDAIIEGITLKIKINATYVEEKKETESDTNTDNN